tara:strand:+ start:7808 stop:8695 length:888 start_codon:yes stop_codon:yes gene_type:complete
MKLISICVPVFNEENNIENLIKKIDIFFQKLKSKYTYEILFTDNCSQDNTAEIIKKNSMKNKKIKYIKFEKNIGYDLSVFYNLLSSNGDASIVIDCDLQDPIEMISDFLSYWEKGYDLVYGIRVRKNEENFFYLFRKFFYLILNKFSLKKYPLYAGDFRIIDKKIIRKFRKLKNEPIITRCISYDYSNNSYGIPYNRKPRKYDESKYPFAKALLYALNTFVLKTHFFEKIFFYIYLAIILMGINFFFFKIKLLFLSILLTISFLINILFLTFKKILKEKHYKKKLSLNVKERINI